MILSRTHIYHSSLLVVLFTVACGGEMDDASTQPFAQALEISPDVSEQKFAVEGLTLWLRPELRPQKQGAQRLWTLRGRTGGNLAAVRSFIIGDGFGRAEILGSRTFVVTLDAHELNSLLSGLRLFVEITPASPRIAPAVVALQLGALLEPKAPDGPITIDAQLRPVNVAGELVYRGHMHTTLAGTPLAQTSTGQRLYVHNSADGFSLDFSFEALEAEAASRGTLKVTLLAAGRPSQRAEARLVLSSAELFRGDPEMHDPGFPVCAPEVQACIDALGEGDFDYGACASYRNVSTCHLPSALPQLTLIEHEEVEGILEAAYAARMALPAGKKLYANVFAVDASTEAPPRTSQVARAWQEALSLRHLTITTFASNNEVESFIASWQSVALTQAATVLYGEAPVIMRLHVPAIADGDEHLLLHYPQAARLIALDLLTER